MAYLSEVFPGFGGNSNNKHEISLCDKISNLVDNNKVKNLTHSCGLAINRVSWEDTARNKNSCWGPNISDMTLHTQGKNMPIFRKPNFTDVTTEVDIDKFNLVVGNESGADLSVVTLKEYLENIAKYTSNEKVNNMYLERDSKILTSSQACILPLENGEVEFNVRLYNYQTSLNDPAVLVIVSSSQGTSCQVLNSNDAKLYFNNNGKSANFLAKRLKDDRKERNVELEGEMTQEEKERNVLYIFQIPLKRNTKLPLRESVYKTGWKSDSAELIPMCNNSTGLSYNKGKLQSHHQSFTPTPMSSGMGNFINTSANSLQSDFNLAKLEVLEDQSYMSESKEGITKGLPRGTARRSGRARSSTIDMSDDCEEEEETSRGFDNAVLRVGNTHGNYYGTNNLELVRDDKYPIRCTVQFYKVTDDIDIPQQEIFKIGDQINKIYSMGSNTSSLVYDVTNRITEAKNVGTKSFGEKYDKFMKGWTNVL